MSKADLIAVLRRHGSMTTQADVDVFVQASDTLCKGVEPLDAADVVTLIAALDAGDDRPEVRWSVLHLIESQGAVPYLLGTLEATACNPGSEWAALLLARLANAPVRWKAMAEVLAAQPNEARARGVGALHTLTESLDRGPDPRDRERGRKVAALVEALARAK
jgi:hypothetical protein